MDDAIAAELTSPGTQRGLGRLTPDARQWAAQSFDPVFGRIFGNAERKRLAARGMDIYDCIFVDGRSLSDLYRDTPERRSYERMESDMKCRFMQHVLTRGRIDVMVTDAAGQEKLIPMRPYDSTGVMAESSRVPARLRPRMVSEEEENRIRARAAESRQRLGDLLSDPKVRRDRTEYIRYARRDREAAPVPERRGLAVPFIAAGAEDAVITTALPIGDQEALLSSGKYGGNDGPIYAECLSALWGLQSHRPGGLSGGIYSTRRLRMPADPDRSAEDRRGFEILRDTFEMTDEMFANILRMTAADLPDRRTMDILGIRVPEQMFYIDGKSMEEYMSGIPEYADMEPDYRPDSEYLRIFRAEVVSATLGGVSPVDIASPEADPVSGNVRSNVRELRVDYSRLPVALARDRAGLIAAMADRQSYQWGGPLPEGQEGLAHIYPEQFTKEARDRRQEQIAGSVRRNFTPLIQLPGSGEAGLTQQQRADYAAVRELSDDRIVNMDSANVERAYPVYEEIRRKLGLGDQETELLLEAGAITCEAELFYIDGVPATEYLWRDRAALRDNNGDPYPDVVASADRQLKAEIAAIAISGRHIVEVGRVAMDAAGNLRAGVTDVHVDLAPLDSQRQDQNAALRASRANRNQESRRERIRETMQARIDRAVELSYTDGEDMFYRSAARRFDRNRPDMTDDYIFEKTAVGNRMRELFGSGISDEEAGRLVSSMAQMYLLSKDKKYHLSDLADPESLKNEKRDAGREVSEALREGIENGNWQAFDAIAARVSQMVHPTEPVQGQTLPQQPASVRRLDMKEELAAVMGLDLERNPAYSQEEFLRLMDSPENSPYVSAVLAYAGHLAGDTLTMRYSMQHELPFAADGADAEAMDMLYAIRLVGEHEEQWLNEAQNFRRRAEFLSEQRIEEIADLRMSLEDTRRIVAGSGIRHENTLQISEILNQGLRPRIRRTGRELSGQLVRDLAERPFADLGLTDYAYPAVTITIPQQFNTRTRELGDLVSLANRSRGVDPARDGMTAAYASMMFDQMFTGGSDPVFNTAYRNRLSAEGMDPLDRIYIEGRSVNDLYREKYRDLATTDPKRAMDCMKTEFMIRLLQGARIDVAAEQNGVEILSAMALQTDIRDFNRRAWLTVPRGEENFPRFVGATETRQGFTVPPMTAEMAESIYESQWIATDRALRRGNASALSAGQDGPETQRVRRSWAEKRSTDRRERLAEDGRTGQVADSIAYRMRMTDDINETGGADMRNALFRLYADGEGEFKRIFGQNYTRTQDDNSLLNAASGWMDKIIKKATYGEALQEGTETVPTKLQERMGYRNTNMTDLFRIDGMTVKEYADAHGLSDMLKGADAEANRKALLASVLVGGEHHVDMIRSGFTANERGENVAYKTGVAEIQIDLSPFDEMVRFYQTRPSRKAERLYGDTSGRSERHQKIKQAADEQLFRALAAEQRAEEAAERQDLEAAADRDRFNQMRGTRLWQNLAAQPAPTQPRQTPAAQPAATQPRQTSTVQPAPAQSPQTPTQSSPTQPPQNPAAQPAATQPPQNPATQPAAMQPPQTSATQPAPAQPASTAPVQPTPAQPVQTQPPQTSSAQNRAPRLAQAQRIQSLPWKGIDREIGLMLWANGYQVLCKTGNYDSVHKDLAWAKFGSLRASLAGGTETPALRDGRVLEEEYKALASVFEWMEDPATRPFDSVMSPEIPDIMRFSGNKKLRSFLYDVGHALSGEPKAQKHVDKMMNDLMNELGGIRFPREMDFARPEKIVAYRQEFINLANLTRIMRDIDRAVNPNSERLPDLEVMHNVFDAAVKVYDFNHIENVHDGAASRYILDLVDASVGDPIYSGDTLGKVMTAFKVPRFKERYDTIREKDGITITVDFLMNDEEDRKRLDAYYIGKDLTDPAARTPFCPLDGRSYVHGHVPTGAYVEEMQSRQEGMRQTREKARREERERQLQSFTERKQRQEEEERQKALAAGNRNTYGRLRQHFRNTSLNADREYGALTGLFCQLMEGPRSSEAIPLGSLGERKEIPAGMNEKIRQFLSNLEEAVEDEDPMVQRNARNETNRVLDGMQELILQSQFPEGLDFSDPEQITAHRDEFVKLHALTTAMLNIDRAVNPAGDRKCRNLEVINNICLASLVVYDDNNSFEERCGARYILDQIPAMMRVLTPAQQQNVILDRDKIGGLLSNDRIGAVLGRADQEVVRRIGSPEGLRDIIRSVDRALKENAAGMADYYNGRNVRGKLEEAGVRCPVDGRTYVHSEAPNPEMIGNTNPNRRLAADIQQEIRGGAGSKPAEKKEAAPDPKSAQKKEAAPKPETSANPNRHLAVELQEEIRGGSNPKPSESKRSEKPEPKPAEKKEPMEKKGPAEKKSPEKAPVAGGMK